MKTVRYLFDNFVFMFSLFYALDPRRGPVNWFDGTLNDPPEIVIRLLVTTLLATALGVFVFKRHITSRRITPQEA